MMKYYRLPVLAWLSLCLLLVAMATSLPAESNAARDHSHTATFHELLSISQVPAPTETHTPVKGIFLLARFTPASVELPQEEISAGEALQRNSYLQNPFYIHPTIHAP